MNVLIAKSEIKKEISRTDYGVSRIQTRVNRNSVIIKKQDLNRRLGLRKIVLQFNDPISARTAGKQILGMNSKHKPLVFTMRNGKEIELLPIQKTTSFYPIDIVFSEDINGVRRRILRF